MYKIAILLASYNGESWIREQIDSILNQKEVDITIFVSCDLSNDKTLDIINSYSKSKVVLLPYGD